MAPQRKRGLRTQTALVKTQHMATHPSAPCPPELRLLASCPASWLPSCVASPTCEADSTGRELTSAASERSGGQCAPAAAGCRWLTVASCCTCPPPLAATSDVSCCSGWWCSSPTVLSSRFMTAAAPPACRRCSGLRPAGALNPPPPPLPSAAAAAALPPSACSRAAA